MEFSEAFLRVVRQGKFIDQRSPVKGCDVFLPNAMGIWNALREIAAREFKKLGVKDYYFPLLIPEGLLRKEEEHFTGFKAEVAWVTEAAGKKLAEKLAIRPTSEVIIYEVAKNWIQSYKDLPLRINQWCNIIRWETKATKPFLRSREFLWHECHSILASEEEARKEIKNVVEIYDKIMKACCIPYFWFKRTPLDTFPGAVETHTFETIMPDGRFLQVATPAQFLGQNFAKAYDIRFMNEKEEYEYAWQVSWGFSTRLIGAIIGLHMDEKGAIIPPKVAATQIVIIPIPGENTREKSHELKEILSSHFRVEVDDRDDYTPGWKFNEYELQGVPIRIEIGPKEVAENKMTVVRRDNRQKHSLEFGDIEGIRKIMEAMEKELYDRAKAKVESLVVDANSVDELKKHLDERKAVRVCWCGSSECEKILMEIGDVRGVRQDKEEKPFSKCIICNKEAKHVVWIGRSY